MALSADEQRALAEIERRLATDDPGLATCLTAFRRPGPGRVLRSPRARIIGSLFTVLLVAMVSLMVYAMIPFRAHSDRPSPDHRGNPGQRVDHAQQRPAEEFPARVGEHGCQRNRCRLVRAALGLGEHRHRLGEHRHRPARFGRESGSRPGRVASRRPVTPVRATGSRGLRAVAR